MPIKICFLMTSQLGRTPRDAREINDRRCTGNWQHLYLLIMVCALMLAMIGASSIEIVSVALTFNAGRTRCPQDQTHLLCCLSSRQKKWPSVGKAAALHFRPLSRCDPVTFHSNMAR